MGNKKGGVGKSITALNLAGSIIYRAIRKGFSAENKVVIVDADTNESVVSYIRRREKFSATLKENSGVELPFIKVELRKPNDNLSRDLVALNKIYDYVIVDTGGYENHAFKTSVGVSDVVYLPFQPALIDVEQLIPTLVMIGSIEENFRLTTGKEDFCINSRLLLTLIEHSSKDLFSEAKKACHQLLDNASISGVPIPKIKNIIKIQNLGLTLHDPQPNTAKDKLTKPHPRRGVFDMLLDEIDGKRDVEVKRNEILQSDASDT